MTFEKMTKNGVCYKKKDETTITEKRVINKESYQKIVAKFKGKEGKYFTATWEGGKISDVNIPENDYKKGNYKGKSSGNFDSQCAVKTAGNALNGIDGITTENYEEIFKNLIKVGLELIKGSNNQLTDDWGTGVQEQDFGAGNEEPDFGNNE